MRNWLKMAWPPFKIPPVPGDEILGENRWAPDTGVDYFQGINTGQAMKPTNVP